MSTSIQVSSLADQRAVLKDLQSQVDKLSKIADEYSKTVNSAHLDSVIDIDSFSTDSISRLQKGAFGEYLPELLANSESQQALYLHIQQQIYNFINLLPDIDLTYMVGNYTATSSVRLDIGPNIDHIDYTKPIGYILYGVYGIGTSTYSYSAVIQPDAYYIDGTTIHFDVNQFENAAKSYMGVVYQDNPSEVLKVPITLSSHYGSITIDNNVVTPARVRIHFEPNLGVQHFFSVSSQVTISDSIYIPDGTYTCAAVDSVNSIITIVCTIADTGSTPLEDPSITLEPVHYTSIDDASDVFFNRSPAVDLDVYNRTQLVNEPTRNKVYKSLGQALGSCITLIKNVEQVLKNTHVKRNYVENLYNSTPTPNSYTLTPLYQYIKNTYKEIFANLVYTQTLLGSFKFSGMYHSFNVFNSKIASEAFKSMVFRLWNDIYGQIKFDLEDITNLWVCSYENLTVVNSTTTATDLNQTFLHITIPTALAVYLNSVATAKLLITELDIFLADQTYATLDPFIIKKSDFTGSPESRFRIFEGFLQLQRPGGTIIPVPQVGTSYCRQIQYLVSPTITVIEASDFSMEP